MEEEWFYGKRKSEDSCRGSGVIMLKKIMGILLMVVMVTGCSTVVTNDKYESDFITYRKFPKKVVTIEMRRYYDGNYEMKMIGETAGELPVKIIIIDEDEFLFPEGMQRIILTQGEFNKIYRKLTTRGHTIEVDRGSSREVFETKDIGKKI